MFRLVYKYFFFLAAILLYSCKTDRPKKAAIEYCECYELKLKQHTISEAEVQRSCDSILVMNYPELHTYYIDKNDTNNWEEVKAFYYSYTSYKAKYCNWQIKNVADSGQAQKGVIY